MPECGVIAADRPDYVTAIHRGGMAYQLPADLYRGEQFLVCLGMVGTGPDELFAIFSDVLAPTADDAIFGMARQKADLPGDGHAMAFAREMLDRHGLAVVVDIWEDDRDVGTVRRFPTRPALGLRLRGA